MSKRGDQRRKRELEKRKNLEPGSTVRKDKPEAKYPGKGNPQEEAKNGKFHIPFSVGAVIIWLAGSVGLAIVVNHFSVSPKALYISAGTLCLLLVWIARHRCWIRLILIPLYLLIIIGTHKFIQNELRNPQSTQLEIRSVTQPDYLPGTDMTHSELSGVFPFGYAVIYPTENKRFRYDMFKNGKMDWNLDLDRIEIEPDFSRGTVTFQIHPISAEGNTTMHFINSTFTIVCPLKNRVFRRAGFNFGNNPVPHVAVLAGDQRNPVFAIGFRIPLPGEGRPPNPPWSEMPQQAH